MKKVTARVFRHEGRSVTAQKATEAAAEETIGSH